MPTPIDPKRLPALRAALETFGPDDKASQHQLADLYGVTNARMTTLIKTRFPKFPAPERHDDKTHWFPARAAVESMIAYVTGRGQKKKRLAAQTAAVMGRATAAAEQAEPEEEEPAPMGPAELDRMASAATRIWRLQVEQGKFVPVDEVQREVRAAFGLIQREVHGLPNSIDPNGEFPPLQRERLEKKSREILSKLHKSLQKLMGADAD